MGNKGIRGARGSGLFLVGKIEDCVRKTKHTDIIPKKVEMINNRKPLVQDGYIGKYLAEKELNLTAALDAKATYSDADFVVIAALTNVYSTKSVAA